MDTLSDEIESVLYIAREVMGQSASRPPCSAIDPDINSLPGPAPYGRIWIQSCRLERRGVPVERAFTCA